jgi:hypothetical protein
VCAGLTAPHPRCGCVLTGPDGRPVAGTFQMGQGSVPAEVRRPSCPSCRRKLTSVHFKDSLKSPRARCR